jgi:seryl-tRNA synthetase
MIDIQRLRDDPDGTAAAVAGKKSSVDVMAVLELDGLWREALKEAQRLESVRNNSSMEIARLKKEKRDATELMQEMKRVSDSIKGQKERCDELLRRRDELMSHIPNAAHESVPKGGGAQDNVTIFEWGEAPTFDFKPKDHIELGAKLDIIDFPRGVKVAGTGFPVLKGAGALLERALINFFLIRTPYGTAILKCFHLFL